MLWQISVKLMKEDRLHLLRHMASENMFLLNHLCRGGSASATGILGPDAARFEKQIAVKWHVVTLQEASDYVEHDILQERFHVTHCAGCAILFNEDTFNPDINVKSIYLHDTRRDLPDQIIEGEQGWVLQGVLSRASFRRAAVSGQKFFTVLSQHISNIYAKKKGIAKKLIQTLRAIMISPEVDLVAGDFHGTACVVVAETCLRHRAPHRCGDPDPFRTTGFSTLWESEQTWCFLHPSESTRLETE